MKSSFNCDGRNFEIKHSEDVKADIRLVGNDGGISLYKLYFQWSKPVCPERITLSYGIPAIDVYYNWDAIEKCRAVPFGNKQITVSRLGYGMPLKTAMSRNGDNAHTVALSDVKSPISIKMSTTGFSRGHILVDIDFFTALTGPFQCYEAILRIDERHRPLSDTVYSAMEWFEVLGYKGEKAPKAAEEPMYSTWYSYGQQVTADDVIKECRLASKMGMKTVILDDGWQTDSHGEVYGYCGDWLPVERKFPDMKQLSRDIHALGMKLIIWYSMPFMGFYAENLKAFEGKFLKRLDNANCYVLDPRYKDVRDFLVNTYAKAVSEWELDGLKLDFIDRFAANGEYSPEMDFTSVEDAVEALLAEITQALKKIKPDILIEFRQPYFGPVISKYGNMMRVWDCPLDGGTNKTQTVNLRLVSGECAVHADMIYWHDDDTVDSVARQLWGTVFSVPQISARLGDVSPEQKRVLENYLNFWTAHGDTLLRGKMTVKPEENGYGYVESKTERERVALLSSSPVYEVKDTLTTYAVNVTEGNRIILVNTEKRKMRACIFNSFGEEIQLFELAEELKMTELPVGGYLELRENRAL